MICRKTMEECKTPGMCAPFGGCAVLTNTGKKIIDGLKDALAGNFGAVTIEGQRWIRVSEYNGTMHDAVLLADEFEGEATAHSTMGNKEEATKCLRAAYALRRLAASAQAQPVDRAAIIEECAKAAEDQALAWVNGEAGTTYGQAYQAACRGIANRLRDLAVTGEQRDGR